MTLISELLMAGILSCPLTILRLPYGEKANSLDISTVKRAKVRCRQLYPKSPCAKRVERKNKMDYQVVCGPRE